MIPILPNELHQLILSLATPPSRYSTGPTPSRESVLSRFSLVSKGYTYLAQSELFRHIHVDKPAKARLLLRTLSDCPGLAGKVRSLRVGVLESAQGGNPDAESFELDGLLDVCDGLDELRIANVTKIRLETLARAQALKRLFIWSSTITSSAASSTDSTTHPPVPLRLPQLQSLYSTDLTFIGEATYDAFLDWPHFPSLTALGEAFNVIQIDDFQVWPSTRSLDSRITSYSFATLLHESLAGCEALRLLDCWVHELSRKLDDLPRNLAILRLNIPSHRTADAQALEMGTFTNELERYLALEPRKLREICVPIEHHSQYRVVVDRLQAICKKKGVVVTLEDRGEEGEECFFDEGYWRRVDEVESTIAEERRKGLC
ncbi:hypothetical protein MNV49_005644 [Pseudohyphozyma bogoriensis]|nr:hypothetical protein MNV49_005644 [Pseudohyphozyma bogoriensis]